mmetsp:Transcript_39314/g.57842  ORF Transcript_39314/g.57842 Transcript_39314/m.57842 type:complete len:229 (-) Transcript_39314:237-923(-)
MASTNHTWKKEHSPTRCRLRLPIPTFAIWVATTIAILVARNHLTMNIGIPFVMQEEFTRMIRSRPRRAISALNVGIVTVLISLLFIRIIQWHMIHLGGLHLCILERIERYGRIPPMQINLVTQEITSIQVLMRAQSSILPWICSRLIPSFTSLTGAYILIIEESSIPTLESTSTQLFPAMTIEPTKYPTFQPRKQSFTMASTDRPSPDIMVTQSSGNHSDHFTNDNLF